MAVWCLRARLSAVSVLLRTEGMLLHAVTPLLPAMATPAFALRLSLTFSLSLTLGVSMPLALTLGVSAFLSTPLAFAMAMAVALLPAAMRRAAPCMRLRPLMVPATRR